MARISLLDRTSELHENALGYFRYFLENDYLIRMSTIAVAEFCVKDKALQQLYNVIEEVLSLHHLNKTHHQSRCQRPLTIQFWFHIEHII